MTSATSSGRPRRPTGVCVPAINSSGSDEPVSIHPGATEFTVIPWRATSRAMPRVSPSTPALAAPYATLLGIAVRGPVVDDRGEFLNRERFPEAAGFVQLDRPEDVAKVAPIDDRTFVVVMTHNFMRDKDYVRSLLGSPATFIAMLGPGARTERLLSELREEGTAIADEDLERIHGPAGLDVGAEGPEEIAAAIVAEIVAVKRGRAGGFLKDRPGPIHDRESAARRPG